MVLLGLIFALLGIITLITSAVIFIIAVLKGKNTKLVSVLILLTSFTLVTIGVLIIQVGNDSGKTANKKPTQDNLVGENDEKQSDPENFKEDVIIEDKIKGTYKSVIKPRLDEIIAQLDSIWTENWQVPFDKMTKLEMTSPELSMHLSTLDQSYFDLLVEVEEIDSKANEVLSAEESSKVQEITFHLRSVIVQRSTAAAGLIEPLRNGTATEADLKSALEVIELSNEDILSFAALKTALDSSTE
ncbi:hypothetical protein ACFPRA_01575 [Sporosarcina soli]|uniref:Uncharacterized protein n=1 Tax=Sporosarcina soli TaxID=334736 RepID=A0ABW0TDV4_9BACL